MEDNSLKINVTISGQSFTTLKQLEDALKAEKKAIKDLDTASQEYTNRSKAWVEAEKEKTRVSSVLVTEQGKLMKSYFATGEALRRTNPAFISFNQVIQDAPYGIRGVGNNIQFLTQQFTSLRSAGMSTGEILKGMMSNILTPMGGLMFAVSAGTSLLTVAMDQLGSSTKDTKDKTKEMNDELERHKELSDRILELRFELGDIAGTKYLEILNLELETLILQKRKIDEIITARQNPVFNPANFNNQPRVPGATTAGAFSTATTQTAKVEDLVKSKSAYLDLDVQILQLRERIKKVEDKLGLNGEMTAEDQEKFDIDLQFEMQEQAKDDLLRMNKEYAKEKEAEEEFSNNLIYEMQEKGKDDLIKLNKEYAKEKEAEEEFSNNLIYEMQEKGKDDLIKLNKEYAKEKEKIAQDTVDKEAQTLRDSINLYNSVFFDPLKASFDAVANGSGNMADAFVASLKKMIVQLLEFAAFSAILSLLFPGSGGFGSIFGKLTGIGGALPTPVTTSGTNRSDISRMSGSSSSRSSGLRVEVVGKIGNDAIYLAGNNYLALKSVSRI